MRKIEIWCHWSANLIYSHEDFDNDSYKDSENHQNTVNKKLIFKPEKKIHPVRFGFDGVMNASPGLRGRGGTAGGSS